MTARTPAQLAQYILQAEQDGNDYERMRLEVELRVRYQEEVMPELHPIYLAPIDLDDVRRHRAGGRVASLRIAAAAFLRRIAVWIGGW